MTYCGEQTAVKGNSEGATVVSLKCKSWTCPDCQGTRKNQLMAEMAGGAPNKFLTLTVRRDDRETAEQAAKRLSRAWRCLRLRIIRHLPSKKLPFVVVVERHKSGWPHLHILCRMPWFPVKLLKEWWQELTGSFIVNIQHLDSTHKSVAYCAKYCGKCSQKIGTTKRYWQSRDYDLREEFEHKIKHAPGEGWDMWPYTLRRMAENYQTWGYTVEYAGTGKFYAKRE